MYLYLMRHGETQWNIDGRIQGSTDIPLNENGIHLAEQTRDGLKKAGISFDKIYASPLQRAMQTAEIVADGTCPIVPDARVAEMFFGEYEGVAFREAVKQPEYENLRNFFSYPKKYKAVGGCESYEEAQERVASFCEEEIYPSEKAGVQHCLIVCHGAIVRVLLAHLCGEELEVLWKLHLPNCSISIYEITDGQARLVEQEKAFYGA